MVTSCLQREGKSTTVANLAVALARSGHRVALVDLDLRQPTLASLFGIHQLTGVTDVVARQAPLEDALVSIQPATVELGRATTTPFQLTREGSLDVLPSGPLPASPASSSLPTLSSHASSIPCASVSTTCSSIRPRCALSVTR